MNIFKLTTHLHHNTAEPGAENRFTQPTNAPFLHVLMRMITLRLYLPATVLTVLIIALSGYFYARLIEREQIQVAKSVAARVDDYLLNADRSLESIAAAIDLEPPSKIDQVLRSEHTIQPFFTSLYLLDENEILAASIPQSTIPAGLGNQDLSRLIRDVSKSGFSEPYISSETGKRAVLASRTLTDGRRILGELDLAYLDQMILEYQPLLPSGQLVFISDDKGTLMTDSHPEFSSWQATFSFTHARANPATQPISRLSFNRPIPVFETHAGLKKADWMVTAELPLRNAITPYLWIIWISLATLLVLWLILVFTINHYGVKQLTAPLEQLSHSVRNIAESEGAIPPALKFTTTQISEIHDLATNFEKIFAVSQQRQVAAMESEQKYRMLIDQSSDAIYVEYRGRFVITNQKFNEMFKLGRDDKEITSIGFIQFVSPASRPLVKDLQRQVKEGQVPGLRYEFSAKARDGREIDLEASTTALPFMDGIAVQSVLRDITDRKHTEQAEREQRILAEALRDSVSALNTTLELNEVIDRIFSNASKVVPFQAASIMLLDPGSNQQAHIVASFGYQRRGGQNWAQDNIFRLEDYQNLKKMHAAGRPLAIPDTLHSSAWKSSAETRWVRSYAGAPIRVQGKVIGFLNLDVDIPNYYNQAHADRLQAFADQAGIAIHNAQLLTDLRQSRDELYNAYETTLEGWSKALELRDYETEGHTQRVMDMTMKLAARFGITDPELLRIRYGTLLHDIGKIGIPDSILFKPGPLNDEEWEVMRRHPVYAQRILAHIPYLQDSLDIPYSHHEKWDGSGYPRGLKGESIPLSARLFAVVDVWDGLRSNRHYRTGWPEEDVIRYIQDQSGKHFDPRVVEVFLNLLDKQNVIPGS